MSCKVIREVRKFESDEVRTQIREEMAQALKRVSSLIYTWSRRGAYVTYVVNLKGMRGQQRKCNGVNGSHTPVLTTKMI